MPSKMSPVLKPCIIIWKHAEPSAERLAMSSEDSKRGDWVQQEVSCTAVKGFCPE